jgi:hypothetical protein
MAKKKPLIEFVQEAIKKGATTAEDVTRSITDMPLKRLEKIESLRGPLKKITKVQDESIGAIYDMIRDVTEQVAKFATDLLEQARAAGIVKKAPPAKKSTAKAPAKKRAAKAPAAKRPARVKE